jgi:hypothetical protein
VVLGVGRPEACCGITTLTDLTIPTNDGHGGQDGRTDKGGGHNDHGGVASSVMMILWAADPVFAIVASMLRPTVRRMMGAVAGALGTDSASRGSGRNLTRDSRRSDHQHHQIAPASRNGPHT